MDCHRGSVKQVSGTGTQIGARSGIRKREQDTHMTTNETYIARLRKLIAEDK